MYEFMIGAAVGLPVGIAATLVGCASLLGRKIGRDDDR